MSLVKSDKSISLPSPFNNKRTAAQRQASTSVYLSILHNSESKSFPQEGLEFVLIKGEGEVWHTMPRLSFGSQRLS